MRRVRVLISGRVQGVAFRYWAEGEAARRGLDGWVRNLADGRVEAVFAGEDALVEEMIAACRQGPPAARVAEVAASDHAESVAPGFQILPTLR